MAVFILAAVRTSNPTAENLLLKLDFPLTRIAVTYTAHIYLQEHLITVTDKQRTSMNSEMQHETILKHVVIDV
jgi:hypothetical protein